MGSAASIDSAYEIDIDKAKELCGDKWNDSLQNRFLVALHKKPNLTITDMKYLAPQLFSNTVIDINDAKLIAVSGEKEWNDELTSIFESSAPTGQIPLNEWCSIVPTLFETSEDRRDRLHKEFLVLLSQKSEGSIIVNYQMYNESFPISGNTLTAARIDEDYGLSDVMPGCRIRLSAIDPKSRTLYENAHNGIEAPWVCWSIACIRDIAMNVYYLLKY
jgi:hypothetical protein